MFPSHLEFLVLLVCVILKIKLVMNCKLKTGVLLTHLIYDGFI